MFGRLLFTSVFFKKVNLAGKVVVFSPFAWCFRLSSAARILFDHFHFSRHTTRTQAHNATVTAQSISQVRAG